MWGPPSAAASKTNGAAAASKPIAYSPHCMRAISMTKERLRDVAAASPIIIWYAFAVAGLLLQIRSQTPHATSPLTFFVIDGPDLATTAFLSLTIILIFIRRLPVAGATGWLPRVVTTIAFNAALLLLILPKQQLSPQLSLASSSLTFAGFVAATIVVIYLGRCFSVLPQARGLITSGPYRYVRHPLYIAEQLSVFGVALQYQQPWGVLVALLSFAVQFPRMRLEEKILMRTFPAYGEYAARTARLMPGIY